jgi:hypothetical protein
MAETARHARTVGADADEEFRGGLAGLLRGMDV